MANPFYMNQGMDSMKQTYQMFANARNPMQLFMNMASQNPQMQPIVQMLQSGNNPQAIFNNLCQQRGINPQEFISNLMK